MEALAAALKENASLQTLDLGNNPIGNAVGGRIKRDKRIELSFSHETKSERNKDTRRFLILFLPRIIHALFSHAVQ